MLIEGKEKGKKVLIITLVIVAIVGVSVIVLMKFANKIVKAELERRLGKTFSVEKIDLGWGNVEATGVRLKNSAGKEVIRIENLSVRADFMGLLKKEYVVSNITLKNPYIYVEVDKQGNIVNPVLPQKHETKKDKKENRQEESVPVTIKKVVIRDGSLDYLDRKVPVTPVLTKVRNINLEVRNIHTPLVDAFSPYTLSAGIQGHMRNGTVKSSGKINLKSKDTDCKTQIRSLDLTGLKPYFQKSSTVNITKGLLDLDINARVVSKRINAPGNAVLKDLEFGSGRGIGDRFMGVPLSLVVASLKSSNNEIPVAFIVKGDLDNPKFSLQEEFVAAMAIALASKLGFSIQSIGEALLEGGATGSGTIGSGVKELGKDLQKIFGR
jgi:hypothetical protein